MRTANGAGKPGNRWEGHTWVCRRTLSRDGDRKRTGRLGAVRDLSLHEGLDATKSHGGHHGY